MTEEKTNCGTCIFWKEIPAKIKRFADNGFCIFDPPKINFNGKLPIDNKQGYYQGTWPVVHKDSVCGKWLKRKEGHVGF